MILLAADGVPNAQIARTVGASRPTVIAWRDRYLQGGIAALDDEPRSGRPPEISEADVVVATLADDGRLPGRLGITHWSARFLAAELGISFASVARIWHRTARVLRRGQPTLSGDPGQVGLAELGQDRSGGLVAESQQVVCAAIGADLCLPRGRHRVL
jgi:transposase